MQMDTNFYTLQRSINFVKVEFLHICEITWPQSDLSFFRSKSLPFPTASNKIQNSSSMNPIGHCFQKAKTLDGLYFSFRRMRWTRRTPTTPFEPRSACQSSDAMPNYFSHHLPYVNTQNLIAFSSSTPDIFIDRADLNLPFLSRIQIRIPNPPSRSLLTQSPQTPSPFPPNG
jgi:hypothetical protein